MAGRRHEDVLEACTRKLKHDIVDIRARALKSMALKIRGGLWPRVSEQTDRQVVRELAKQLLRCLEEPALEEQVLQVLRLILQDDRNVVLNALREERAAERLVRASDGTTGDKKDIYEQLLDKIYATKETRADASSVVIENKPTKAANRPVGCVGAKTSTLQTHSYKSERHNFTEAQRNAAKENSSRAKNDSDLHELIKTGWRFPPVILSTTDDQRIFEYQVKLRLRSTTTDIVEMCDSFRHTLLRDFPSEVFLQRPEVLEHFIQLTQLPLLSKENEERQTQASAMEEAFRLSFGVNYFDSVHSTSFSCKTSNLTCAVFLASLRAIEGFVVAIKKARDVHTDPVFQVHATAGQIDEEGNVSGEANYPRSDAVVVTKVKQETMPWSLAGAAHKIILSLLPLLRSSIHPRMHILNVLHETITLVRENGPEDAMVEVERKRVKNLLDMIAKVVGSKTPEELKTSFSFSVFWRVLELTVKLLTMYPADFYTSDGQSFIPGNVQELVRKSAATSAFESIFRVQSDDLSAFERLAKVDAGLEEYVDNVGRSKAEWTEIEDLVIIMRQKKEWKSVSNEELETAAKLTQALTLYGEADAISIAESLAQMSFVGDASEIIQSIIQNMIVYVMSTAELEACIGAAYFNRLHTLLTAGKPSCGPGIKSAVYDARTFSSVFTVLAERMDEDKAETLWGLVQVVIDFARQDGQLDSFKPLLPFIQHYAYMDPSTVTSSRHRALQRTLVEIANELERSCSSSERIVLISRCLLHASAYVRRAASSGVLHLLSDHADESFSPERETLLDPFSDADIIAKTLLQRTLGGRSEVDSSRLMNQISNLLQLLETRDLSVRRRAWRELAMLVEVVSCSSLGLLVEMGKVTAMLDVIQTALRDDDEVKMWALQVVRNFIQMDRDFRRMLVQKEEFWILVLFSVYSCSWEIKSEAYWILFLLTCDADMFVLTRETRLKEEVSIPLFLKGSFGFPQKYWDRGLVSTTTLSCTIQRQGARIEKPVTTVEETDDLEFVVEKVTSAKTHAKFLNGVYHLLQLCGHPLVQQQMRDRWKLVFQNYLTTPPKSVRDEMVVSCVVCVVHSVLDGMDREQQFQVFVVVKKNLLPLLTRAESTLLSLQIIRLLLSLAGDTHVSDLFLSLAVDTDLLSIIATQYTSVYSSQSVLHASALELVLAFLIKAQAEKSREDPTVFLDLILNRLQPMLAPMIAVVTSYRLPTSFDGYQVYSLAVQCLVALYQTFGTDALTRRGVMAEDGGSWMSRLLYDHTSHMRYLGFRMLSMQEETDGSCLQLALDTALDASEADMVRSEAVHVVSNAVMRDTSSVDGMGSEFVLSTMNRVKELSYDLPFTTMAFVRLLRVLWVHRKDGQTYGDMETSMDVHWMNWLVQSLSLREERSSVKLDVWIAKVLPAVLQRMDDCLFLIQSLFRTDAGEENFSRLAQDTPLVYQLVELMNDLNVYLGELDPVTSDAKELAYKLLTSCSSTLSSLVLSPVVMQAVDVHALSSSLMKVLTALLQPHHPLSFRVSLSPVIIAASATCVDESQEDLRQLGMHLFDVFKETCTPDHDGKGDVPAQELLVMAFALGSVLEKSESIRRLVVLQDGVKHSVQSLKELCTHIRATSTNAKVMTHVSIQLHILGCLVGGDFEAQQSAHQEKLLPALLENWDLLQADKATFSDTMQLLTNFVHGNKEVKRVCMKAYKSNILLSKAFELVLPLQSRKIGRMRMLEEPPVVDASTSDLVSTFLKSILLHNECLQWSVKSGYIDRLVDDIEHRLSVLRKTEKRETSHVHHLANLLHMVANVACLEEGAQVLCNRSSGLYHIFSDVLSSTDDEVALVGALFIRNLSCSKCAKTHFSLWEKSMALLLESLEKHIEHTVGRFLAYGLWGLVSDHQSARSLLLRGDTKQLIGRLLSSRTRDVKSEGAEELGLSLTGILRWLDGDQRDE